MSVLFFLFPIFYASLLSICQSHSRHYHIVMWLSLWPLIIIGFFRWEIGTDWPSYIDIFNAISSGVDTIYEPGWVTVNLLSSYIGDFRFFVFFVYLLILIFIVGVYYKYPYAITILFFLCFYRFGVYFTRIDFAAICFIFFASYNKLFLSFLSALFHKVFIVSPVILFLSTTVKIKKILLVLFVLLMIFFVFSGSLLDLFMSFFGQTVITHYEELSSVTVNRFNSFLKLIILLSIVVFSTIKKVDNRANVICFLLLVFIWLGENFISQGLARLYALSFPFLFFLVVGKWRVFSLKRRFFLVFCFLMVFIGWTMSPFYNLHFPVKIWWFNYL